MTRPAVASLCQCTPQMHAETPCLACGDVTPQCFAISFGFFSRHEVLVASEYIDPPPSDLLDLSPQSPSLVLGASDRFRGLAPPPLKF
jgi:hypothetical protein